LATGDPLSQRLVGVLSIDAPIMQSGMAGVAGPELVAAVSNAGGLGVMAALRLQPDVVHQSIQRIRETTDRPFGVTIWLHSDVRVSPDPPGRSLRTSCGDHRRFSTTSALVSTCP